MDRSLTLILLLACPIICQADPPIPQRSEYLQMMETILRGQLGPGSGWFKPSSIRYTWERTAETYDQDHNGRILPNEFVGSADQFNLLDRDRDGAITANDLQPPKLPTPAKPAKQTGLPSKWVLLHSLWAGEMGAATEGPMLNSRAPDFTLADPLNKKSVTLSAYIGKKPVVLIFGSFT